MTSIIYINKRLLFLTISVLFLFTCALPCHAEKIYMKDGKVLNSKIEYRNKGAIWLARPDGSYGIGASDIEKIENDDGSVSRYDHKTIAERIESDISQKKYNEAIGWCDFLLESYPDSPDTRYLRATLYQKTGDFGKARDDYEFLVKKSQATARVYNNLGVIFAQEKNYDEAKLYFEKASEKDPGLSEARDNIKVLENRRRDNK